MSTLVQNQKIIPLASGMISISGNTELESFNMAGWDEATIILQFSGALSTAVSAPELTFETGSADSGDQADATFHYRVNQASNSGIASADVLGTDSTASALALTGTTYAGKMLVCTIMGDELPTASKTYNWITPDIGANSSVGAVMGYAILSKGRYVKDIIPTAI
jgi:hypothetical protein